MREKFFHRKLKSHSCFLLLFLAMSISDQGVDDPFKEAFVRLSTVDTYPTPWSPGPTRGIQKPSFFITLSRLDIQSPRSCSFSKVLMGGRILSESFVGQLVSRDSWSVGCSPLRKLERVRVTGVDVHPWVDHKATAGGERGGGRNWVGSKQAHLMHCHRRLRMRASSRAVTQILTRQDVDW